MMIMIIMKVIKIKFKRIFLRTVMTFLGYIAHLVYDVIKMILFHAGLLKCFFIIQLEHNLLKQNIHHIRCFINAINLYENIKSFDMK